jgi:signal transduction histidine kinase
VPAPQQSPDRSPAGTADSPSLRTPAEWIGLMHRQTSEERVLESLVLAVFAGTKEIESVFLLRPEEGGAELKGWVGVRRAEVDRAGEGCSGEEDPSETLSSIGAEVLAPETTGLVRCIGFSVASDTDVSVDCLLDATVCMGSAGDEGVSPLWASRLQIESVMALPVEMVGTVQAVLVVSGPDMEKLEETDGPDLRFLVEQAGLALERLRARQRLKIERSRLATLGDVSRSLLRMQGLSGELGRLLTATCQTLDAAGGTLWLVDRETKGLYLAKTYSTEEGGDERSLADGLRRLAEDVTWRREAPLIEDATYDERIGFEAGALGSIVAVPLVVLDQPRGALILHGKNCTRRSQPEVFTRRDKQLLSSFGALTAVVTELDDLSVRSGGAEEQLENIRQERTRLRAVADLGETSVRLAREMANPIGSIIGFARRVQRVATEEDANREYLEIVIREAERLERLVNEHLQFASLNRIHLGMCSVNHILQKTLSDLTPEIESRRIRLLKKLPREVPALLLDEEKIGQAFENILRSAIEGVSTGGRLLVQSRAGKEHVVVEVCHDGPPIQGDVLDQLFVPFGTGGRPGIGLGLALAQRVVQDHGGEIGVQARGDWGHIVALSLPIQDNTDRRRRFDRRGIARDRRNRIPLS